MVVTPDALRDTMTSVEDANRALVIEAFDALFNRRDYVAAEEVCWSPDYIQHSVLTSHPAAAACSSSSSHCPQNCVTNINSSSPMATTSSCMAASPAMDDRPPGWWPTSCAFADGKLAEHWDVIQDEARPRTQSASGLPMFGDAFPGACGAPAAPATSLGADPSAEPSLLLQAFTRYLRNRPGDDDTESIRAFNDGQALEGISGYSSIWAAFLRSPSSHWSASPSALSSTTTGVATSAARHRIGTYRWPAPWRSPHRPECMSSTTAWLPTIAFPQPLTIAWRATGGPSAMAEKIPRHSPCSGIPPAAT